MFKAYSPDKHMVLHFDDYNTINSYIQPSNIFGKFVYLICYTILFILYFITTQIFNIFVLFGFILFSLYLSSLYMPKLSSTAILKDYNKTVGTNKDKLSAIDNVLIGVNNKYIFICTGKVNKEKADITILEKYKICDINVKENMLFSILETPRRKYILPRGLTKKLQLEKAKNMISKI